MIYRHFLQQQSPSQADTEDTHAVHPLIRKLLQMPHLERVGTFHNGPSLTCISVFFTLHTDLVTFPLNSKHRYRRIREQIPIAFSPRFLL